MTSAPLLAAAGPMVAIRRPARDKNRLATLNLVQQRSERMTCLGGGHSTHIDLII